MMDSSSRSGDYDLLPTSEKRGATLYGHSRWIKRRRNLIIVLALAVSSLVVLRYLVPFPNNLGESMLPESLLGEEKPLPPLYPEYHQAELALPQHDRRNPFRDGRKYMWVADHTQCQ